jgi:hypothetical protein
MDGQKIKRIETAIAWIGYGLVFAALLLLLRWMFVSG